MIVSCESKNGWKMLPPCAELVDMIMMGLAPGTRQWVKGNIRVLFSPEEDHGGGEKWSHLSISLSHRYPTWDEILDARYTFFPDTQEVVQVLPPKSEYVNMHRNCFHLWAPTGKRITPYHE